MKHFASQVPDIVQKVYDLLPWLAERHYVNSAHNLLVAMATVQLKKLADEKGRQLKGAAEATGMASMLDAMEKMAVNGDEDEPEDMKAIRELVVKAKAEKPSQLKANPMKRRWTQSRKPGVQVRCRPRFMFEEAEYSDVCPCCGESRV
jgi:hypothetical protein